MVFRQIGGTLESRVIKWFDYLWANKAALDEETIFNMLPKKLKLEMAMQVRSIFTDDNYHDNDDVRFTSARCRR